MKTPTTNKVGAPKKLTVDNFDSGFAAYVKATKENPIQVLDFVGKDGNPAYRLKERPLTIEGFENYMCDKYNVTSIQHYLSNKDGAYAEFLFIVSRVKKRIRQDQLEGGMAGIYNQTLTARLNGLAEKVENTTDMSVKLLNIDPL